MMKELQPEMGFRPPAGPTLPNEASEIGARLEAIALNAVRRMYSPEFVNRLDAVITYKPLDSEALALILDQQIVDLQQHVHNRLADRCFNIEVSDEARRFLLEKGTSPEYGARELKRSIHKFLTQPLATLVIESKSPSGSTAKVVLSEDRQSLSFITGAADKPIVTSRPTILIVDDNGDFLRLLSLELTSLTEWRVRTAQFVSEAKEIRAAEFIDFALLDFILPDGNGVDLGVELKKLDSNTRVAIMTGGELGKQEEAQCKEHDFDTVNKPFLPQHIVSLVRQRLKRTAPATA
jgi:CheY-like chemotaxis protein